MEYQIVYILDSLLGQHKLYNKGELYYFCPFCSHHNQKFAVSLEKRAWHCWKCGKSGRSLQRLLKSLNASRVQQQELAKLLDEAIPTREIHDPHKPNISLPVEYKPLWKEPYTIEARHAIRYLINRQLTRQDIAQHRIGYCEGGKFKGRVIVPSYDKDGQLNFFLGRAYHESSMNYMIPEYWDKNIIGFEYFINWEYPLVIVEGVYDAMAIKRNAIPLFGKTMSKKLQERIITEGVQDVYLALDNDALKDTLKVAEKFMKEDINVYVLELNGKDPSIMGFEAMQCLIKAAKKLTFAELVRLKMTL